MRRRRGAIKPASLDNERCNAAEGALSRGRGEPGQGGRGGRHGGGGAESTECVDDARWTDASPFSVKLGAQAGRGGRHSALDSFRAELAPSAAQIQPTGLNARPVFNLALLLLREGLLRLG